jgi:hypothetical protein
MCVCVCVTHCQLLRSHSTGDEWMIMEHYIPREKVQYLEKNLFQYHFAHQKSHMD